jgi:hypothetical protein
MLLGCEIGERYCLRCETIILKEISNGWKFSSVCCVCVSVSVCDCVCVREMKTISWT